MPGRRVLGRRGRPVPSEALGILLISGDHERAHYAFVLASGAAAIGRRVVLFATNQGCRALLADWSTLAGAGREAEVVARGVGGLDELRGAAAELGVRLIACEAGLRMAGLDPAALAPGVEVGGVVTFLEAAAAGQLISL
ncbi:MAG: DsrE/DsrF/DrsH-like family protein [Rhodospirillales bacterium]|nr:DsrE/DsrF/DrsH-like family protein [Rhodospirillales bacterium]MDE2197949.1 DsrE/DsrF/DrsH-like family protein [Rhodospirillales bacterium]MDE2576498.1 DsrE/DsrF/DrsH-like family protein [Rhodospirillales bacterium]